MKYIVMEDEDGNETLFTFPRSIPHDAMAESLVRIRNRTWGDWKRLFRQPVSAGFVDASGFCYGSSETLGLVFRPEDNALLAKQMEDM